MKVALILVGVLALIFIVQARPSDDEVEHTSTGSPATTSASVSEKAHPSPTTPKAPAAPGSTATPRGSFLDRVGKRLKDAGDKIKEAGQKVKGHLEVAGAKAKVHLEKAGNDIKKFAGDLHEKVKKVAAAVKKGVQEGLNSDGSSSTPK